VVVGRKASASPDFSLVDLAGSSGRLDILLRCLRAGLLVSHGLRRDAVVYLVLLGGPLAPRVLRVRGAEARFLRPDERALATLAQKALAEAPTDSSPGAFVEVRPGVAVARGGVEAAIADARGTPYLLEEGAPDLREAAIAAGDVVVFVGDHRGFDDETRATIAATGARALGVGPISVHADDAIAIVSNELDRRAARG
jgi:tRNA (pseudouridine54-N1)-methyltransferase